MCRNSYSLFTSPQYHQVSTFTHVRALVFSAFFYALPTVKETRSKNVQLSRATTSCACDPTRTLAGVTDETLSRKSLARVQDTAFKKAQVSSARTSRPWRHTNTFRNHGYNAPAAIFCAASGTRSRERRWRRLKRSRILGPYKPYGLFQTKGEMCAKFGWDRFRNVNLYKVQKNLQTFSFIYKKMKCFRFLLVSLLLVTGRLPPLSTLFFSFSFVV